MTIQPLDNRALLKPIEIKPATKSAIIIPESAREKPIEQEVVAVGPGRLDEHGKRHPVGVKVGDVVLCGKFAGTEIKVDGKDYRFVDGSEILGWVVY